MGQQECPGRGASTPDLSPPSHNPLGQVPFSLNLSRHIKALSCVTACRPASRSVALRAWGNREPQGRRWLYDRPPLMHVYGATSSLLSHGNSDSLRVLAATSLLLCPLMEERPGLSPSYHGLGICLLVTHMGLSSREGRVVGQKRSFRDY